jgi:hypothetical protein
VSAQVFNLRLVVAADDDAALSDDRLLNISLNRISESVATMFPAWAMDDCGWETTIRLVDWEFT